MSKRKKNNTQTTFKGIPIDNFMQWNGLGKRWLIRQLKKAFNFNHLGFYVPSAWWVAPDDVSLPE